MTRRDQSLWRGLTIIMATRLEIDPADYSYTLVLDMADRPSGGARALSIQFDGVTNLNLRGIGGGLSQIMGLEVESIKERQWERLNFRDRLRAWKKLNFSAVTTKCCANTPPNPPLEPIAKLLYGRFYF